VENLRADPLGEAQLKQGCAEALDASRAKSEIGLDMEDRWGLIDY
jgi:hypothetical protein